MDPSESLQRFYNGFAGKYDLYMPWDKRIRRERRFFKYMLDANGVNTVLDCFCGTGFHVSMLSDMGYEVEGIDISPAMVTRAKENLKGKGQDHRVSLGDVKALDIKEKYDCALSIGNSLPHEFGDENVYAALKNMYGALKPGGICIVQIENYERLYEDHEPFIPSVHNRLKNGTDTFIFAIKYQDDRIIFHILSVIERDGLPKFSVDTVEYNPIRPARLLELVGEAGFRHTRCYEDFNMAEFGNAGTYDIIVVAKK